MSVGFTNPIPGSSVINLQMILDPTQPGGAISGWMPKQTQLTDKRYEEFEQVRFTLKQAWNTQYKQQLASNDAKAIQTPFRVVMNAGDLLSRVNYACGGTCQTPQSRPNLNGLRQRFGAISGCGGSILYSPAQDKPGVPAAACNVKYVYDSSDYTTFLKQQAMVRNYNDYSFGGDESNASQSALRAIRRY